MYHTMLVGGLLCSALLDAHRVVSVRTSTGLKADFKVLAGRVNQMTSFLTARLSIDEPKVRDLMKKIRWSADASEVERRRLEFRALGASEATAAPMAVDAAIILAAQDGNLACLAGALQEAMRLEVRSATVLAGADFLARQIVLDPVFRRAIDSREGVGPTLALCGCLYDLYDRFAADLEVTR